jgi:hypothetical protein
MARPAKYPEQFREPRIPFVGAGDRPIVLDGLVVSGNVSRYRDEFEGSTINFLSDPTPLAAIARELFVQSPDLTQPPDHRGRGSDDSTISQDLHMIPSVRCPLMDMSTFWHRRRS